MQPSECGESKGPNGGEKSMLPFLASLVASPGAATSAKEAIPRRTGLSVKTEASAQAIDCLQEESDKQRWIVQIVRAK